MPEAGLNDLDLRFNVGADFYELAEGTLASHFIRCSTGQFSPFSFYCIAGRKDLIGITVRNSANSADISTPMTFDRNILKGDIIKITFAAGNPNSSLRFWLNGVEQVKSPLAVAGVDKIYNHNFATAQMGFFARPDGSRPYGVTICNVQIRIGGVLKFFAPLDGTTYDVVTGEVGTITKTVSLAERCDNSSFYCEEYGFAVKSGAIYPKLLSGTGYAGLVGEPDAVYQGLIATKGQPEIGTKQYLGTEYDFGDAAEITDAGISWGDWDGEDTNENTVGTAETDLDTDYCNAITASLMTCTSIAGYAGTSNVSKRLFFKVADRVMKDDGSFLAESGRVQEILVYKTDLTAGQIAKVRKYCKDTGV